MGQCSPEPYMKYEAKDANVVQYGRNQAIHDGIRSSKDPVAPEEKQSGEQHAPSPTKHG